jgi:hypothetical protein
MDREGIVNKIVIVLVALVVGLLTGCDRGDQGGQDQGAQPTADPTPAEVPQTTTAPGTSAEAVVADLRAHGFEVTSVKEGESFPARETLDMRIDGVEAGVLTFGSVDQAQSWAETSASFGGIAVVGDDWAVSLDSDGTGGTPKSRSRELAAEIAAKIGGTVR